jgi:hypothetical protein
MTVDVKLKQIRDRAWLFLSPAVAAAADMTLAELQQFVAGTYHPSETQLQQLARRLHFTEQVR